MEFLAWVEILGHFIRWNFAGGICTQGNLLGGVSWAGWFLLSAGKPSLGRIVSLGGNSFLPGLKTAWVHPGLGVRYKKNPPKGELAQTRNSTKALSLSKLRLWTGWVGERYHELLGIGLAFLNMRSGPCHLNIRTELVFYTTSEPSGSGPATTYLNVVTVL